MGTYLLSFILFFSFFSHCYAQSGAMGLEGGVGQLTYKENKGIGPSFNFHAEINLDPLLGFFGEAGKISAKDGTATLEQTAFTGGFFLEALPVLEFRLGLATTVIDYEAGATKSHVTELGPLAGASVFLRSGVWKFGTSATVIHTGNMQSFATRLFALVLF
jgi:hypothetical protein